ncbi:MAG: hypothetical protein ABR511_14350 [Acidimicrobiales bacterium]
MHSLGLLGALAWEPQIKGALYVAIAVVILPGSGFLLLSTNMGSRLGFLLAAAGFFGWMFTLGAVWWAYGTGPMGLAPTWKGVETVVGDVAQSSRQAAAARYPAGWTKLDIAAPEAADAQAVVDARIVGTKSLFKSSSNFLVVGAAEKGGDTYGPFHLLNMRPFNVFHSPHYLVITVQAVLVQPTPPGGAPPKPTVDPSATPVSVLMVRDLGNVREHPAVVCISCGLLFGIICYRLHIRDREAMAQRAGAGVGS